MKDFATWPSAIIAVCALATALLAKCDGNKDREALKYYHGPDYQNQVEQPQEKK